MVCAPTGKQRIVANIPTLIPSFVMARLSYRFADVGPAFAGAGCRVPSIRKPSAWFLDVGSNERHAHHA
jgi:hypothetical protein